MKDTLQVGGVILAVILLCVIGFSIYNDVASDCDGVVVKDYYGMPACVESAP